VFDPAAASGRNLGLPPRHGGKKKGGSKSAHLRQALDADALQGAATVLFSRFFAFFWK
jgi:hypothetical protein